jgi:hypothetical protein
VRSADLVVYSSFMPKRSALARTVHPITSSMPKSKAWSKFADRALGGAIAAVGVVFLFHPAPWFIIGIVITAIGLVLLIAAVLVGVPEQSPTPAPERSPTPAPEPARQPDVEAMRRKAHKANDSLATLLDGTEPSTTVPPGGLASGEATDASSH